MLKKLASVRVLLSFLLLCSIIYAGYSIYYKINYWGFSFTPKQNSNVWSVEAHISFEPTGEPIKVSLTTPRSNDSFKILEENVVAEGYKQSKTSTRLVLTNSAKDTTQDLYYKILLFDNSAVRGKVYAQAPSLPTPPIMDEQKKAAAKQILNLAKEQTNISKS